MYGDAKVSIQKYVAYNMVTVQKHQMFIQTCKAEKLCGSLLTKRGGCGCMACCGLIEFETAANHRLRQFVSDLVAFVPALIAASVFTSRSESVA